MPELTLSIGDRKFTVACQEGEELHLQTAASVLDAEAKVVNQSVGRVPEGRMLLMAGLMLADKMAAVAEQERYAEERIDGLETRLRQSEERAAKLRLQLESASNAPTAASNGASGGDPIDLEALTRVAAELEKLAEELEASTQA